jgi:hypothetical protein
MIEIYFPLHSDHSHDPAIIENVDQIFAQAKAEAIAENHGAQFRVLFLASSLSDLGRSFG